MPRMRTGKPVFGRPARPSVRAAAGRSETSPAAGSPADPADRWKAAVHDYVRLYNQAETDRLAPDFGGLVTDAEHLARYERRMQRLREQELERGVLSLRSETNANLLRISESGSRSEVAVLVELHIRRTMEHRGRTYTEQRIERERLWLANDDGYRVARIEPIVSERRPRYGSAESELVQLAAENDPEWAEAKPESIPYINYDLLPFFKHQRAGIPYRRDLAASYADRWWNEPNPAYENFEVNCTNYISQCIFAGNAPMNYTGKRNSGWWYRGRSGGRELWSYSWAVANSLQTYLSGSRKTGMRATVVDSAGRLELGDVITYDWAGDGRYQHSTVVTAFDADGMPLVNANTVPSRHRYWDYRDSYAWTEQTRYRFFHIADEF
ncbi:amidase domain-containing protein [Paenibacillus humicola]|uniref:amidase domain-containing protein n=1 Tax=Paenibacillus humicola TaxID=3110540 RepID=UPI00237C0EB9|nr:amidase domain-containing protein [Paenibacillus humicola]